MINFVVGGVVLAILLLAIRSLRKTKKTGGCSCGCGCGCSSDSCKK